MDRLGLPPEQKYMSKEQFREICHIGTHTAQRLIENNLIPVIDTHAKTSRYLIAVEDVERYLIEREREPEKYGYRYRTYEEAGKYDQDTSDRMKATAEQLWECEKDVLSAPDVTRLLGYARQTVYKWTVRFGLKSIKANGRFYIPKCVLIEFVASKECHLIIRKTEKHFDLIRRAMMSDVP